MTPGGDVTFVDQNNNGATTTATADSTGAYSIMVPLVTGSNTFTVTTLDAFGSRSPVRSRRWSTRRPPPQARARPSS